ncbi:MAG: hypothetical protein Q8M25_15605 [Rhodoferax sp.]|nr:hypothetical protein [Rhodoferax sp.]
MALTALCCHGAAQAALPPAAADPVARKAEGSTEADRAAASADATTQINEQQDISWVMPAIRLGGMVSYNLRRDWSEGQQRMRNGLTATVNASGSSFIWQPWFARINGSLGLSMSRDGSDGGNTSSVSKNLILTGVGELSVLAQSPYPFEAHIVRSNNRVSSDLVIADGSAHQRIGFTQHYYRQDGEAMVGWESDTQTNTDTGNYRQRSLRLNLAHNRPEHRIQVTGDGAWSARETTGESTVQSNLSLQHSYTPDPSLAAESMVNISRAGYRLQRGTGDTRLAQLSSLLVWRPADPALTVSGGARALAVVGGAAGFFGDNLIVGGRVRNAIVNANLGVNYSFNRHTRLTAGLNLNRSRNNGANNANTSQSVGASYQPDQFELVGFHYNWSTSAAAINRTGEQERGRELTGQLGHNLSRDFRLTDASTLRIGAGQSLSVVSAGAGSRADAVSARQLTHSGSITWELSQQPASAMVQLSVSDSRALADKPVSIQMVNFQASSNLPTSGQSSWSGNLTIQAVRQSANALAERTDPLDALPILQKSGSGTKSGFVTTSSGALTYQNQRVLGVRRLRFVSDLRLDSDALLPLLGSAKDQQTLAWDNRLDYQIGRTLVRLGAQMSTSRTPKVQAGPTSSAGQYTAEKKSNRSIAFSITRGF